MAVKTNREILSRGSDIYARKKFKTHGVDEVSFDRGARAWVPFLLCNGTYIYDQTIYIANTILFFFSSIYSEYLTGFHKRKVARKEKAAEYAKKRAHEEHLAERKRVSLIQKRKKKEKRSITWIAKRF